MIIIATIIILFFAFVICWSAIHFGTRCSHSPIRTYRHWCAPRSCLTHTVFVHYSFYGCVFFALRLCIILSTKAAFDITWLWLQRIILLWNCQPLYMQNRIAQRVMQSEWMQKSSRNRETERDTRDMTRFKSETKQCFVGRCVCLKYFYRSEAHNMRCNEIAIIQQFSAHCCQQYRCF